MGAESKDYEWEQRGWSGNSVTSIDGTLKKTPRLAARSRRRDDASISWDHLEDLCLEAGAVVRSVSLVLLVGDGELGGVRRGQG